jgi:hypothetical protein
MSPGETYLGDGLYASFDGFMITLRAPREHEDHWVGLEPEVFAALLDFARCNGVLVKRKEVFEVIKVETHE